MRRRRDRDGVATLVPNQNVITNQVINWSYSDPRVRARFQWEVRSVSNAYSGLLWAMERQMRKTNDAVSSQIRTLRKELGREFGLLIRTLDRRLHALRVPHEHHDQRRDQAGDEHARDEPQRGRAPPG